MRNAILTVETAGKSAELILRCVQAATREGRDRYRFDDDSEVCLTRFEYPTQQIVASITAAPGGTDATHAVAEAIKDPRQDATVAYRTDGSIRATFRDGTIAVYLPSIGGQA